MIASGLFWCAYKGLKWNRGWGFNDPRLDIIWEEQITLPRGSKAHHRTDLIVEWNTLDPQQRGTKLLCAFAVLTFAIGVGLGWLL